MGRSSLTTKYDHFHGTSPFLSLSGKVLWEVSPGLEQTELSACRATRTGTFTVETTATSRDDKKMMSMATVVAVPSAQELAETGLTLRPDPVEPPDRASGIAATS